MDSPQQPDFSAFLGAIAAALREQDLPFMLIGGQAVLLHGQPRLTEDIDITLGADPTNLLFAARPRDWEDAVSVVRRKGEGLDWDLIMRWAIAFAEIPGREAMPGQVDRLRRDA